MGGKKQNTREVDVEVDDDDMPTSTAIVPPPPVPPMAATQPAAAAAAEPAVTQPAPTTTAAAAREPSAELDLAFCCDCTGSMGAYIRSAQDNILAIAQQIHAAKSQQCSLRFALVKYRDHPPQDSTFVTEVYPFTKSLDVMKSNVDTMAASGGGDGPEAVTAGLYEVLNLNWRENATKVCVFIADAPPHGLGESGDGFPNGSPDGHDPIVITKQLADKCIAVYAVGVEPTLSTSYKFARDFMMMVASVTSGKFLPLGKAEILAKVIVATAIEGIEMEQLWQNLEEEIAAEAAKKNERLSKDELCTRVEKAMSERAKEVKMQKVMVENPYMDDRYDMVNHCAFAEATSLAGARAKLNPTSNMHVAQASAGYAWTSQAAKCDTDMMMDEDQQERFARRGIAKRK